MSELKCCPFCGGEAEMLNYSPTEWLVHCIECDGMVEKWRETEEEAIEQWNRRTPMDNIVEKLEYEKERHEKDREYWFEKSWKDCCIYNKCDISDKKCECFEEAINIVKQEINNGENNT